MRVLVTGGSGFIGSGLIRELGTQGHEVSALLRPTSPLDQLRGLPFQRITGDLQDRASLVAAVQGHDWVIHLAGAVTAPNREGFFRANAQGTENLIEACVEAHRLHPLQKVVVVSSLAAGGPVASPHPRREDDGDQPVSYYGESKREGEMRARAASTRVPIVVVRPPMVYGPRDRATFLFVKTVQGRVVPVFSSRAADGQKHYSAIHVEDLCRGLILAAEAPLERVPSGEVFYLSSDETFSFQQMMTTIGASLGVRPFFLPVPSVLLQGIAHLLDWMGRWTQKTYPLNRDKLKEIEPDFWTCSNQKAKKLLGFTPQFNYQTGWEQTVGWYKENGWIR
jgi:nucleoside-diphosphate-sugar epimerase